jgi:serine/threonine protein kinase
MIAKDFINRCLTIDVNERITAHQALEHEWLIVTEKTEKASEEAGDLLPNLRTNFNARRTFKKAINLVTLSNHFGHSLSKSSSTNTTSSDEIKPVNEGIDQVLENDA